MLYQIYFYVPEAYLEQVKQSLFAAGAGKFQNYSNVSWQVKGNGQFCPLAGSKPFLGKQNVDESVTEYKVEMLCESESVVKAAVAALKKIHPYEEPAYGVIELAMPHTLLTSGHNIFD